MQNLDAPPRLLRDSNGFLSIAFSHDSAALVTLPLDYPRLVQALNRNGATPPFAYSPPVKRWNLRTGFSETIFQDPRISYYSTLSESLNRLASFQEDGSILVWDLRHPHVSPVRFPGPGHKSNWGMLAFSNDERFLASVGARDFAVRVWNLANTNTEPVAFRGASAFPIFSLDDSRLLAGSNSDIRLWDLREPNAPPVEFKVPSGLIGPMALSQDGTRLAYGDQDGNVWVWNLWTAAADELCTRVSRNLTSDEWRLHVGKSIPYERTCPALPAGTRAPR
jgi:hypothetical protein